MKQVIGTQRQKSGLWAALFWCLLLMGCGMARPSLAQSVSPQMGVTQATLQAREAEARAAQARQQKLAQEAEHLLTQIDVTTRDMVQLAALIQSRETRLQSLRTQIEALNGERRQRLARLLAGRDQLAALLAGLQTLSQRPPALAVARPGEALDAARAIGVLNTLVPEAQRQGEALRVEIAALEAAAGRLKAERASYQTEVTRLRMNRTTLDALRMQREKRRAALSEQAVSEAARAEKMAQEAADIRDLLARLEMDNVRRGQLARLPGPVPRPANLRRVAPAQALTAQQSPRSVVAALPTALPAAASVEAPMQLPTATSAGRGGAGRLMQPVSGRIVESFGTHSASGARASGVRLQTEAAAQVVAPDAGRVVFSGQYRGYGEVLIIAHGDGYHSVLAGMARIDSQVGASVRSGEPVGVMGEGAPGAQILYIEVRRRGEPINPLPWRSAGRAGQALNADAG